MQITITVNGSGAVARSRAAHAARALHARQRRPHRHQRRLRHVVVRRLHACHLDGESVKSCTVLAVQADGADDHHHRGPGRRRRAAPDAAGVPREPRPAVRLLHARHGDGGDQPAEGEPAPHRGTRCARASRATCAAAPATTTSCKAVLAAAESGRRHDRRRAADRADDRTVIGHAGCCAGRIPRCSPARRVHQRPQHPRRAAARAGAQPVRPRPHHHRSTCRPRSAMPGVVAAYTGADLASLWAGADAVRVAGHRRHEEPRALPGRRSTKACYVGDGVAVRAGDAATPPRATRSRRSTSTTSRCPRSSTSRTRCRRPSRDPRGRSAPTSSYMWELEVRPRGRSTRRSPPPLTSSTSATCSSA